LSGICQSTADKREVSVNSCKIINLVLCNLKKKKDFSIRKYGAKFLYSTQRKTQISCKFQFSCVKLTCFDSSEKGLNVNFFYKTLRLSGMLGRVDC
jgi:hypothetical protein